MIAIVKITTPALASQPDTELKKLSTLSNPVPAAKERVGIKAPRAIPCSLDLKFDFGELELNLARLAPPPPENSASLFHDETPFNQKFC